MTVYLGFALESWDAVMKHLLMYSLWSPDWAVPSGFFASKYIGWPKVKVLVPVTSIPDAVTEGDIGQWTILYTYKLRAAA